jgi:hypothetical protein
LTLAECGASFRSLAASPSRVNFCKVDLSSHHAFKKPDVPG